MKKKVLITLEVEFDELPRKYRPYAAADIGLTVKEAPGVRDMKADQASKLVKWLLRPVKDLRFFDYSVFTAFKLHARISKVTVLKSEFTA